MDFNGALNGTLNGEIPLELDMMMGLWAFVYGTEAMGNPLEWFWMELYRWENLWARGTLGTFVMVVWRVLESLQNWDTNGTLASMGMNMVWNGAWTCICQLGSGLFVPFFEWGYPISGLYLYHGFCLASHVWLPDRYHTHCINMSESL